MKKQTDIFAEMRKKITGNKEEISSLQTDISKTQAEIDDLTNKVNNFADPENVTEFFSLKADLTGAKDKLLMLNNRLKAIKAPDKTKINADKKWFADKKKEILNSYEAQADELINQLELLCKKTNADYDDLTSLYEQWRIIHDLQNEFSMWEFRIVSGRMPRMIKYVECERHIDKINKY